MRAYRCCRFLGERKFFAHISRLHSISRHNVWTCPKARLPKIVASCRSPPFRGAKTVTKVEYVTPESAELNEPLLPQSFHQEKWPELAREVLANQRRFPHCIVLTKVGNFYETYFDQAIEVASLLDIKLTKKEMANRSIPMAGFPLMHLDRYLRLLVQDFGRFVAMAEEFRKKDWDRTKNLFDRRVVRIITPGTLIDEKFLREDEYNFLLSISMNRGGKVGLAWMDLSTGDFFTQVSDRASLFDDVARIGPSEILLPDDAKLDKAHPLLDSDDQLYLFTFEETTSFDAQAPQPWMVEGVQYEYIAEELEAAAALLKYVDKNLFGLKLTLQPPIRRTAEDTLRMDAHTLRALEIKKSIREFGVRGTLLSAVRRTVTKSGARLLSDYLCAPLTSVKTINYRLDLVTFFVERPHVRAYVRMLLKTSSDAQRTLQKFSLNRGEPEDLLGIKQTIHVMQQIKEYLASEGQNNKAIGKLLDRLQPPLEICKVIDEAIDEEALRAQMIKEQAEDEVTRLAEIEATPDGQESVILQPPKRTVRREIDLDAAADNWVIRPSFSKTLRKFHKELAKLRNTRSETEERFRILYKSPSLTLRNVAGYGFIIHIKISGGGNDLIKDSPDVSEVHRTKTTRYYLHKDWTLLGTEIEKTKAAIRTEEIKTFDKIKYRVLEDMTVIRRSSRILDEIDVAISFAEIAEEQGFTRPVVNYSAAHKIVGGRHAIVEHGLRMKGRQFVRNDCHVGDKERVLLITGPNMGGKSTFLRQNALITILAQTGSYVPAEKAEIGIVDQVFSRVGAADNLFAGQSTFMVEMMETGDILQRATRRSFVIMDEVGRGTTHEDGLAIAAATLIHLHNVNRCRTLFATHMHELASLISMAATEDEEHTILGKPLDSAGVYCTNVAYLQGDLVYLHKVVPGVNRQSHGLHVAQMAGVPQMVIEDAKQIIAKRQNTTICTPN